MQWMLDIQIGRRNLPPAQRISVVDKFKKKIQEQAAMNKSDAIAESNKKEHPMFSKWRKMKLIKKKEFTQTKKMVSFPNGEHSKRK